MEAVISYKSRIESLYENYFDLINFCLKKRLFRIGVVRLIDDFHHCLGCDEYIEFENLSHVVENKNIVRRMFADVDYFHYYLRRCYCGYVFCNIVCKDLLLDKAILTFTIQRIVEEIEKIKTTIGVVIRQSEEGYHYLIQRHGL